MMKPSGKCIAKKCDDCNFFYQWDMEGENGLRKTMNECVFLVLSKEIPRIRGSIDGVQEAANESRDRSMEAKDRIEDLGVATILSLKHMDKKLLENK